MNVIVETTNNPEWFILLTQDGYWITEGKAIYILNFVKKNEFNIISGKEYLD